jgi:hypothetical protein
MQMTQAPVSEQYFNGQMTAAQLLGIRAGGAGGTAGAGLPSSTAGAGDSVTVWWKPDSPTFWVAATAVLTLFGMAGADARVRLGKRHAGVSLGTA